MPIQFNDLSTVYGSSLLDPHGLNVINLIIVLGIRLIGFRKHVAYVNRLDQGTNLLQLRAISWISTNAKGYPFDAHF